MLAIQYELKRSKEGFKSSDQVVKINESIVCYIEVKKIEQNLDEPLKNEQIKKYKELSRNIIITNHIEFVLIQSKEVLEREALIFKSDLKKPSVKIDDIKVNKVINILNRLFSAIPQRKLEILRNLPVFFRIEQEH
ncbi:hypothetical protein QIA01_05155 (plasmid) [Borreliella americana]